MCVVHCHCMQFHRTFFFTSQFLCVFMFFTQFASSVLKCTVINCLCLFIQDFFKNTSSFKILHLSLIFKTFLCSIQFRSSLSSSVVSKVSCNKNKADNASIRYFIAPKSPGPFPAFRCLSSSSTNSPRRKRCILPPRIFALYVLPFSTSFGYTVDEVRQTPTHTH